jgi:hypothetical protein
MITSKDINKNCFIKFRFSSGNKYSWENVGALIAGITPNKVMVKMPDGEIVAVEHPDVRVIEPRPQSK